MSKNRPKVCFATVEYPPDMGGVSKSAGRIVDFLAEEGFEVHIFAPDEGDSAGNFIHNKTRIADNIVLYRMPIGNAPNCDEYQRIATECIAEVDKTESFDIFHGFFLRMGHPCIEVAGSRPTVSSIRGIDAKWCNNPVYQPYMRIVAEKSACITSVSSESFKELYQFSDIKDRELFIPNSIKGREESQRWTLNSGNRGVIGTVATFRKKKNIPLLIEAYSKLDPAYRKKLLLVGDFIQEKRIDPVAKEAAMNLMRECGVEQEVTITGYLENSKLPPYYNAMEVFVLSSDHEGMPNTVLEAGSFGVPIVATAVDGLKDIMEDGVNGLLVPPKDADAMSAAIQRILKDDSLAQKLSRGALEMAERCSPQNEKKLWVDLYNRLLSR